MKPIVLALALAVMLPPAAQAGPGRHLCNISSQSQYSIRLTPQALLFFRDGGIPSTVEMRRGELTVDGKQLDLSDADHRRIAEYEATIRALVPQVKAIARDAADIAYTAVGEVANSFAGDGSALRAKLERMHAEVRARIDASFDSKPWNEKEFGNVVESAVTELVPALVGELVGVAVKAALAGDEAVAADIEKRANRIEAEIEQRVETQARQIEARVEALCPTVAKLAQLEADLDVRLPGGGRIDLIQD